MQRGSMVLKRINIENSIDGIILKGELSFWAKDYTVRLKEPFEAKTSSSLMLAIPVKYVIKETGQTNCKEINILESSKKILVDLYLKNK